jgi:hypothetical protein
VARANALIFAAIKKILEGERNENEQRSCHKTIVCRATNFMSFWLMYGAEAVLSEEVKY